MWFSAKAIEAQRRTLQQVEFILKKTRLLDGVRGKLNARQENALLRMFAAGPEGFLGGLSAANYMSITSAPPATATRDLAGLMRLDALTRTGENKATRYRLNLDLPEVKPLDVVDIL